MLAIDITRHIDYLGYEATQDMTDINYAATVNTGWKIDKSGPSRATSAGGNISYEVIEKKSEKGKNNIELAGIPVRMGRTGRPAA